MNKQRGNYHAATPSHRAMHWLEIACEIQWCNRTLWAAKSTQHTIFGMKTRWKTGQRVIGPLWLWNQRRIPRNGIFVKQQKKPEKIKQRHAKVHGNRSGNTCGTDLWRNDMRKTQFTNQFGASVPNVCRHKLNQRNRNNKFPVPNGRLPPSAKKN